MGLLRLMLQHPCLFSPFACGYKYSVILKIRSHFLQQNNFANQVMWLTSWENKQTTLYSCSHHTFTITEIRLKCETAYARRLTCLVIFSVGTYIMHSMENNVELTVQTL